MPILIPLLRMNQTKDLCITCQKPKAQLQCGLCHSAVCKYCARILDETTFEFLKPKPPELSHEVYCELCYLTSVNEPHLVYTEILDRARDINVYLKTQSKETRLLRRREDPVKVENCIDEQQAMMNLAFLAAEAGYNGLIDVEIKAIKVRSGAYQTTTFNGSGVPAQVRK